MGLTTRCVFHPRRVEIIFGFRYSVITFSTQMIGLTYIVLLQLGPRGPFEIYQEDTW